jgi:arsenite methyltransferase
VKRYLEKIFDWKTEEIANVYDELPLWSSPFGMLLLNNIPMAEYKKILDVGFGTGFPLIDLAQRIGNDCKAYGIDPWTSAVKRAKYKIEVLGLENIELLEGDASKISFEDNYFDLITSNLGINNFENPRQVLSECCRVLKPNGKFCTTSNLTGTFQEFYEIFLLTLNELGLLDYAEKLEQHLAHRGTVESMSTLLKNSGFQIHRTIQDTFASRYLNGTAFLNHSTILIGFINSWRDLFYSNKIKEQVFHRFENNLNNYSITKGELKLTIPMIYFECGK